MYVLPDFIRSQEYQMHCIIDDSKAAVVCKVDAH